MKPFVNKIEIAIITAKTHQVSRCLEEGATLLYMSCRASGAEAHANSSVLAPTSHDRLDNIELLDERAAGEVGVEG